MTFRHLAVAMLAAVFLAGGATVPAVEIPTGDALKQFEEERTDAYAAQLEEFLRAWLVDEYPARAAGAFDRDYSSIEAFSKSVEPNRRRWRMVIKPLDLTVSGELKRQPHPALAEIGAEWLTLPLGHLTAQGLLAVPSSATPDNPVPLVIAQHGLGSHPERTFGILDDGDHYHEYARDLFEAGFAVLAPMDLRTAERVNRIERLCRLADTSLPGIELSRVQRLLDEVLKDPRIDQDRVGIWGVSRGGQVTMFWMPLEPRIKVGVVCAWFNHRRKKMVIPDPRYSCFLETAEEHAFHDGWLTEFTDSDVVTLICPRPLLVQTGKKDRIAHWPFVLEEFAAARSHYEKLGIEDRIQIDLHEGGHEPRNESGVKFLVKWLIERPQAQGE